MQLDPTATRKIPEIRHRFYCLQNTHGLCHSGVYFLNYMYQAEDRPQSFDASAAASVYNGLAHLRASPWHRNNRLARTDIVLVYGRKAG